MRVACKNCSSEFEITNNDDSFYKKIKVPYPTHCPDCRRQRRLAFRNERNLYPRTCDLCSKQTISIYSDDKPFKVYCIDCWWSNKWDETQYARDFDFNTPFFNQFFNLQLVVPRLALMNKNPENSEFCNYAGYNKNSYLAVGGSWYNDTCMYGELFQRSKNSLDCTSLKRCELCYQVVGGVNLYDCAYLNDCFNSSNCYFSNNLIGCDHCMFSANLRNKSYYIFNKSVSKEEFEQMQNKMASYELLVQMINTYYRVLSESIYPKNIEVNCEGCTGDYMANCKNVKEGFEINDIEDGRYLFQCEEGKDLIDCCATGVNRPQLFYECVNAGEGGYHNKFSFNNWNCNDVVYCDTSMNSKDCFGCSNVKGRQYCILNKQYSKDEYIALASKIVEYMKYTGEYGEFFPMGMSPFAYNESRANDYYPLNEEVAKGRALKCRSKENKQYKPQTYKVPDNINDVKDDILDQILGCDKCSKNYKILFYELRFYRDSKLPVPRYCYDCRFKERMKLRNPMRLWNSQCAHCYSPIKTGHSPEKKLKVYCDKCYLAEVS